MEPSVQQRLKRLKGSTEFTKRINVIGVTDQKGRKNPPGHHRANCTHEYQL
ncbi:hypothetical protein [Escherichia coli]|uniref:hypothetical protein n=1 Tax=Escherichia coli TaxID=562 RepID=UPI003D9C99C1